MTALLLGLLSASGISGCGGCSWTDRAELAEKEKKLKPKPDFEPAQSDTLPPAQEDDDLRRLKPGHFAFVALAAQANNFDFQGQLETSVVDVYDHPVDLERTVYNLASLRPALLPKGQAKNLEIALFPPRGRLSTSLLWRLRDANRLGESLRHKDSFNHMPAYQYNLLILARDADRYRYVRKLPSITAETGTVEGPVVEGYYRVLAPNIGKQIPLPPSFLFWTSFSHILWDDVDASLLGGPQRQALVDWLHWGGQLVISGPNSLDALASGDGAFLQPYLPATTSGARGLDAAAISPLLDAWKQPAGARADTLQSWVGVTLVKDPQAEWLDGTGELIAERRVGRGRIIVTAFRLTQPELVGWNGFDQFFNACILRRGPRQFTRGGSLGQDTRMDWVDHPREFLNPAHVTGLRLASRDGLADSKPSRPANTGESDPFAPDGSAKYANDYEPPLQRILTPETDPTAANILPMFDEMPAKRMAGTAGWNDLGLIANSARQTLRTAAGIRVPGRTFVITVLAVYLVVIVPVNWLVFRLLGKVEWAWVAVPIIALGCGAIVIHLAQLDIGFVRAVNEVGFLEAHAGHPRGHLTRYSALYSSLSVDYEATLDDPTAVVLPFALDQSFEPLMGQQRTSVTFRTEGKAVLSGFRVASNSTGMLHSEQMVDLAGTFALRGEPGETLRLVNGANLAIEDAVVLRRTAAKELVGIERADIGRLEAGAEAAIHFAPSTGPATEQKHTSDLPAEPRSAEDGIDLGPIIHECTRPDTLGIGEMRLVGVVRAPLPGLSVTPAASQSRSATVVVVHLAHAPLRPPRPDQFSTDAAIPTPLFDPNASPFPILPSVLPPATVP